MGPNLFFIACIEDKKKLQKTTKTEKVCIDYRLRECSYKIQHLSNHWNSSSEPLVSRNIYPANDRGILNLQRLLNIKYNQCSLINEDSIELLNSNILN